MNRKLLSFFLLLACNSLFGQCVLEPWSVQKRTYQSDLVIEGRVLSQESFWNDDHSFIYTASQVLVGKVFSGFNEFGSIKSLTLITEGGTVGLDALSVEPSLQVESGEVGVFFLDKASFPIKSCNNCGELTFKGVASEQSFIKYDEITKSAHAYYEVYNAIEAELHTKIEGYAQEKIREIKDLGVGFQGIPSLAAPIISSFSVDTVSSGTGTILTINGSNFGIVRGDGFVEFLDPNFGDGRFFTIPYPSSYKSWSNFKIEVFVPTRAGTGKIRVTNNSQETGTSSDEIYVKYTHSNVGYQGTTGIDSGYFQVNHIDDNKNGGYTWQFNQNFAKNNDAVNAFLRAAETWRCETLMNWELGDDTNVDKVDRDNVNVVRFTEFTDSKLGVCYSWYSGCFNGGSIYWYVNELDIEFDSTRTWNYTTNKPKKSEYDFETVATHELGHGHQLSHVIDKTKIMHYSLTSGDRNVELSDYDVEGGEYVREKSKAGDPCGPGKYIAIDANDCNITKPKALLTASDTLVCPGQDILFTDVSEGKVNSRFWSFGDDASTESSTQKGPHTIQFDARGTKVVQLIVTNDFGSDTAQREIVVMPDVPVKPDAFVFTDTVCVGEMDYVIPSVPDATEYLWELSAGGTFLTSSADTNVSVSWTTPGMDYSLSVKAINSCGESDTVLATIDVIPVAVSDFTFSNESLTVDFTDLSKNASGLLWHFGDGDSSKVREPSHKFPTKAVYTVGLTAFNVCSDSTIEKDIIVNYGVGVERQMPEGYNIYPIPATNSVTFDVPEKCTLILSDNLGRVLLERSLVSGNNQIPVDTLSRGVVVWQIRTTEGVDLSGKIVLE